MKKIENNRPIFRLGSSKDGWNVTQNHSLISLRSIFRLGVLLLASGCATVFAQSGAQSAPELVVQTGPGWIQSMALSPDGRVLASAGLGNAIKLWDTVKGRELRTLVADNNFVYSIAFSPDGRTLASGDAGPGRENKAIELWDVRTGKRLRKLTGHSDKIISMAFSPDGRILASGSWDKTIKIWDVGTGKELRTLKDKPGFWSKALSIAVSAATGQVVPLPKDQSSPAWSVAFSPDGRMLASGSDDNTIRLWDPVKGKKLRTLEGHSDFVISIAFSPDGRTLASGSVDNTIKLWDPAKGKNLRTLKGHTKSVNEVVFTPDGRTLASGSFDTTIKYWDVGTGRELRSFDGHSASIHAMVFSLDGKILMTGGEDSVIKFRDVATGTVIRTLEEQSEGIYSVAFSPDGKMLISGCATAFNNEGNKNRTTKLWSAMGQGFRTLVGHTSAVMSVAFSPNGKIAASSGWDKTIRFWDVKTGNAVRTLTGHTHWVNSIAFSPDGRILASGSGGPDEVPLHGISFSKDNTIKLWDVETGKELRTLTGHFIPVYSIAFSPDGRLVASAGNYLAVTGIKPQLDIEQSAIKLWDVTTGMESASLKGHTLPVKAMAFSPDKRLLASTSYDNTTRFWDLRTGRELLILARDYDIQSLAFSPDGKMLASGNNDRTIKLWDTTTGREIRTLRGHSSYINTLAFSPDGRLLASGGPDGTTRLWDVAGGRELASLIAIDKDDWLVVTPDGLFDGSPRAWKQILWRFSQNTFDLLPVESFFNEFYYPGLLADILHGNRPQAKAEIAQLDRRQPELKISLATSQISSGMPISARTVRVKVEISNAPSGSRDVRLFRNGSLIKAWRGDVSLNSEGKAELEATIPIISGENSIVAYAFNSDNIKSEDAALVITGAENLNRKGTAYILAIGVNQYANQQYNLKYAVADTKLFGEELQRQQVKLGTFASIKIVSLFDRDATKSNILLALKQLSGTSGDLPSASKLAGLEKLKPAQPEDAVFVYFAGHGTAQQNQFYLIPHDLGYTGARTQLNRSGLDTILEHSISDRDLEQLFEGIDAGYLILIIDACNSGQALEAEEKRRGPMNSKGLAQLAYEKGMYILTAAQSYQAAMETAQLGHGYLTYALAEEGLKGKAADTSPRDGQIMVREWLDYATERVPQMQLNKRQQMLQQLTAQQKQQASQPGGKKRGGRQRQQRKDRALVQENASTPIAKEVEANLQQPRVFYRREIEARPLIVARP